MNCKKNCDHLQKFSVKHLRHERKHTKNAEIKFFIILIKYKYMFLLHGLGFVIKLKLFGEDKRRYL